MDLTKIDKPFGELDRETKVALFTAWLDGAQIEWEGTHIRFPSWLSKDNYRVATTKPSIDWSHVAPQFKWMATDANGMTWLYEVAPTIWQTEWQGGASKRPDTFASFRPGTCDWKDSLVQRPE